LVLSLASFLLLLLVFSSVTPLVSRVSPFAYADDVTTQTEIENAITTAAWLPVIITLKNDIALTGSLNIPVGADVTLRSGGSTAYELVGADGYATITVNGKLTIEGIIVTHATGALGRGITNYGTLVLLSGEISGNTIENANGGGVYNDGSFTMSNGKISDNQVSAENFSCGGGGVYNGVDGEFTASGTKFQTTVSWAKITSMAVECTTQALLR
jgi:hypothetical protein